MKPLADKIFVLPDEQGQVSEHIQLMTKPKGRVNTGYIVDFGDKVKGFKKKQRVIFNKHHASVIKTEDGDIYILEKGSVYGIIED